MPIPAIVLAIVGAAASAGAATGATGAVQYGMNRWRDREGRRQYGSWTDRSPNQWKQRRRRNYSYRRYEY